jgi:hypothetical protein
MQKPEILIALTPTQADFLEDLLDEESERMQLSRKPGAGPGRKEKLLNSISEAVISATARKASQPAQ